MEQQPIETTEPGKDLSRITDDQIREVASTLDKVSWNMFKKEFSRGAIASDVLQIDYNNLYLLEGFNWFGTKGISDLFRNREFVIPDIGTLKIVDQPVLDFPRKDELSEKAAPLYPNDARLAKINYAGSVIARVEMHWNMEKVANRGVDGTNVQPAGEWIFGKIPIMVGSKFCNLSKLTSVKEVVAVGECPTDHVGYFVINGLETVLISQNYRIPNSDIVILSKFKSSQQPQTVCDVRSRGSDGNMFMHRVFVMAYSSSKVKHSDRRLYIKIDWIQSNIYDSSDTVVGINIVSIFRLAYILMFALNPLSEFKAYSFDTSTDAQGNVRLPGYKGQSTFQLAYSQFVLMIREYAGEKFYDLIKNYVTDTVNESSIEEQELDFWAATLEVEHGDPKDRSIEDRAASLLEVFAFQFMPHLSGMPYAMKKRELERHRYVVREQIAIMHDTKLKSLGRTSNPATRMQEVDTSLQYLEYYSQQRKLNTEESLNRAEEVLKIMQDRGIYITQEYVNALDAYEAFQKEVTSKLKLIAYMCVRVLRVEMGVDSYDDRDSLTNQMYEHPGLLMNSRLASMLREIAKELAGPSGPKRADLTAIKQTVETLATRIITANFASNFSKGEWNSKRAEKKRTGVTDKMPASVAVAKLSFLRRISAQSTGHSKSTASRELTGLQVGGVCLSETPEGQQCGNVEHLASAAFITNDSSDSDTLAYRLNKLKTSRRRDITDLSAPLSNEQISNGLMQSRNEKQELYISNSRSQDRQTPFFFNGMPMGWVNGIVFRKFLIRLRREGYIHPHTGVHYTQKMSKVGLLSKLSVKTTGGRIVQPLIIAENPEQTVNMLWRLVLDSKDNRPATVSDMIANGYIEFIDSAELEFLDVAVSVSNYLRSVQDGLPEKYSHILLNPAFLMGIAANIMPFANNNPVVRNSYFTQMVKQPVDVPKPTYRERPYTAVAKLQSAHRPIVKTDMYDAIMNNEYFGMNVKVLLTPHKSGEEDGIVINRRFLDMGGLASTKYSAFPIALGSGEELEFSQDFMEMNPDPDRYGRGIIRVNKKVVKTMADGTQFVATEPVVVRPDELLARKTWTKNNEKEVSEVTHDSLRDGIVDRILWSKSAGNTNMGYVIIRTDDTLWYGDKITSRYSQKGVIAAVVEDEDMPFNAEDGTRADIIMNPQAFPSRMTVGMLNEMFTANAYVFPDKNKTVFILYQNRGLDIYAPLERLFVVDKKKWDEFHFDDNHVHRRFAPGTSMDTDVPMHPSMRRAGMDDLLGLDGDNGFEPLSPTGIRPKLERTQFTEQFQTMRNRDLTVIFSEEAISQEELDWLKANDEASKLEGFRTGVWALRFYGDKIRTPLPSSNPRFILVSSPALNPELETYPVEKLQADAVSLSELFKMAKSQDLIAFDIAVTADKIEVIEGLRYDTAKDTNGQYVNPMRGIRMSNLPKSNLPTNSSYIHLGSSIHDIYLRGNVNTPVASQYVAGYKPEFFERFNIYNNMLYDFIIPEDMRVVKDVIMPGRTNADDFMVPPNTKFSMLEKEKTPIKQLIYVPRKVNGKIVLGSDGTPLQELIEVETTITAAWIRDHDSWTIIPKQYVIDLPDKASDIFAIRKKRIDELRSATIFKEGISVDDAVKELKLMGYEPDMKSEYINGKTGRPIEGGLVAAYSYYMPLKHKVKYKIQARGTGKNDSRTRQPVAGRNRGGGLRFNYADALASIKSGAASFVADRLLDSSAKQDVFICKDCSEICYREGEAGAMLGSIVCPLCKTETQAIKVTVPYSFILQRNLAMGAGVRLKIEPALDDEPGYNKNE
jgi:DNA-directed RNA polymerase beta subunit